MELEKIVSRPFVTSKGSRRFEASGLKFFLFERFFPLQVNLRTRFRNFCQGAEI